MQRARAAVCRAASSEVAETFHVVLAPIATLDAIVIVAVAATPAGRRRVVVRPDADPARRLSLNADRRDHRLSASAAVTSRVATVALRSAQRAARSSPAAVHKGRADRAAMPFARRGLGWSLDESPRLFSLVSGAATVPAQIGGGVAEHRRRRTLELIGASVPDAIDQTSRPRGSRSTRPAGRAEVESPALFRRRQRRADRTVGRPLDEGETHPEASCPLRRGGAAESPADRVILHACSP